MPEINRNRIVGSLLALALGDAYGAPHEGGLVEQALWCVIGSRHGKRRWTDDTQMTLDVVESLIQHGAINQTDLSVRFARSYQWSRGYGSGAAKLLKRIRRGERWESAVRSVYADGSYGNGGAMRSPAVGLFFARQGLPVVVKAAKETAAVTHAHPLAQEGAALIAAATALSLQGADPQQMIEQLAELTQSREHSSKLTLAAAWLQSGQDISPTDVALRLGRGMAAVESCVTAIYVASRFMGDSFDNLLKYVIQLGGDVDTIAAMACGIWGAAHELDELPREKLNKLEDRDRLLSLASSFAETVNHGVVHE